MSKQKDVEKLILNLSKIPVLEIQIFKKPNYFLKDVYVHNVNVYCIGEDVFLV